MLDLAGKEIFIVCSDPGAAQAVLTLYKDFESCKIKVTVIARKAARFFAINQKIPIYIGKEAYGNIPSIKYFVSLKNPIAVITGTSLVDNLERNYIKSCRELDIPVVSFIDWWSLLKQRFVHTKNRELILPRCICVVDSIAKKSCQEIFGRKIKIEITGNPYLSKILKLSKKYNKAGILKVLRIDDKLRTILFFAEPIGEFDTFNQFEIFKRIIIELAKICDLSGRHYNIIIKFHPNGEKEKIYRRYALLCKKFLGDRCPVVFVKKKFNAPELIAVADYVWGMDTTPLLEAILRGRLVSSFLPDVDFSGPPYLRRYKYCPSANSYSQFPKLIKNLMTNRAFVDKALRKQRKYKIPKGNFAYKMFGILASELGEKFNYGKISN
jgi:hypothetical protein